MHIVALGPYHWVAWLLLSAFTFDFSAAIFEVGGVPYSVLEPVLERCTPDQLYRIEEYNHVSILFGWEEGSFLACTSRNSFVPVTPLWLKGRSVVRALLWAFKQACY